MSQPIIFFADLHIHSHGNDWRRVDDALEVLEWIHREANLRGIKKVWFLGDWFHVRGYLYPSILAKSFLSLLAFKQDDIEVNLLVGNHDMPHKNSTKHNSLTAFSSICNVIEQPMVSEEDGWNFYWLPYVENVKKTHWAINNIVKYIDINKKSALLAHLDIQGAMFNSSIRSTQGITVQDLTNKFDVILTGHYHTHQKLGDNIWYIGSPYQQNFSEAEEEKGFIIFDNGKIEYVKNTFSPKYLNITSSEVNEGIKNNYVNIVLTDSNNIVQVRENAIKFGPRSVSIKIDRSTTEENRQLITIKADAKDVYSLMKEWIQKTANTAIYDQEKLLSYGMSIVSECESGQGE